MKLILCPACWDVFKLAVGKLRKCECGRCTGRYLDDGHRAEVNGKGISIAIGNGALEKAIYRMKAVKKEAARKGTKVDKDTFIEHSLISHAWVRPNTGSGNPRQSVVEDLE